MKKLLPLAIAAMGAATVVPASANTLLTDIIFYGSFSRSFDTTSPVGTEIAVPLRVTDLSAGGPSFIAFCLEPFQDLTAAAIPSPPQNGTGEASYSGPLAFTNAAVQTLYNNYYGGALVSGEAAAAFQLALWELAADAAPGNMTGGTFAVQPGTTVTLAQNMLNNTAPTTPGLYMLTQYNSLISQDILSATLVPEPATVASMLLGLGVVGVVARRRQRKTV